jgi:hypothetical protein
MPIARRALLCPDLLNEVMDIRAAPRARITAAQNARPAGVSSLNTLPAHSGFVIQRAPFRGILRMITSFITCYYQERDMSVKITRGDKFQKELAELSSAMASLDGEVAQLRFTPSDPASVQRAIEEMEAAVDRKAAAYSSNPMVVKIAEASKEAFRKKIQEIADEPA